jgi:hypothetical protein
VLAHPVGERDVVRQQLVGIPAATQPLDLRWRVAVQQADCDAIEPVGGGRGDQLSRCDGVSGQQHVAVARQRALDDGLDAAVAPCEVWSRRDLDDVAELDAVDLVAERRFDGDAAGRLAHAARAGQQEQQLRVSKP